MIQPKTVTFPKIRAANSTLVKDRTRSQDCKHNAFSACNLEIICIKRSSKSDSSGVGFVAGLRNILQINEFEVYHCEPVRP